jgi:uncharacterized protein (TIGR02996 family)
MQAELEQRLLDDPDDLGAFAVYADWLTDRGDPRGAFLHLQLQLEDPSLTPQQRQSLQDRERHLLQKHGRDWLGQLAEALEDVTWRFERGFLGRLDLRELTAELAQALHAARDQLCWLRHLSVDRCRDRDAMQLLWDIPFPNVRGFSYGDGSGSLREEGHAGMLASNMPRLQELSVSGRRVEAEVLVGLELPRLRSLAISCAYRFHTDVLADNRSFGQLRSVAFYPHAIEPEEGPNGYLSLADIEHIARSHRLPSLCELTLWQCTAGDKGCLMLIDSCLLERLEVLDLSYGEITDEGARQLVHSGQLGRLRSLRLDANSLTERGIGWLREAGIPELHVRKQQLWEDRGYLAYGDCE